MTTKQRSYKVTDQISGLWVPGTPDDLEEIVSSWYTDPTPRMLEAVRELFQALRAGEPTGELEEFLALRVEPWPAA